MDLSEPSTSAADGRRNDRRERLIAEGAASFRAIGVNASGIGAICAASDVGKGVFTHHFPGGKTELIREVISSNAAEVDAILDHYLQHASSVADAVGAIFGFYADLLDGDPDFGCPLAAAVVDVSSTDADAREMTAAGFRRWQDAICDAQADQSGNARDPALAAAVVAAFEGAILLARSQRNPDVLRQTAAAIAPLLSSGTD